MKNIKVGFWGCGAIGAGIALAVRKDLVGVAEVSAVYDIDASRAQALASTLDLPNIVAITAPDLIASSDLIVEAVSCTDTRAFIRQALLQKRHVLCMSVGQLLEAQDLFDLAQEQQCALLIPSGAIAGIDAIKAATQAGFEAISITTRKPINGLVGNPYFKAQGIELEKLTIETIVFEGAVYDAVKHFPQNINVAATLALASRAQDKITVRIITGPEIKANSHTIEAQGAFGKMMTCTENNVCPDNPKTSYLAVLSGIQTIKQYCVGTYIGT